MPSKPTHIFVSDPMLTIGRVVSVSDEESHYLQNVMRCRVHDSVTVLNIANDTSWSARVSGIEDSVQLEIDGIAPLPGQGCRSRVKALCLARSKGSVEEEVVTKAVELGVEQILLWDSVHSVRKGGDSKNHGERLERVGQAAARQSGKSWLPTIAFVGDAERLVEYLHRAEFDGAVRLVCSLASASTEIRSLASPAMACAVIGPEGDVSESERALFASAGFLPLTLGPFTLRVATAAAAVTVAIDAVFGPRSSRRE